MIFKIKLACFLVLLGSVFAEEASLPPPCNAEDRDCVKESMRAFLAFTAKGIPQFDVRPLDPITIPLIQHTVKEHNIKYTFSNMTIVGMKDLNMIDYNIDPTTKSVLLRTEAKLHYNSDFEVEYVTLGKSFAGDYNGDGKAIVTVSYPYGIITDDKGVHHFDVGKEKIECQAEEATGSIDKDLIQQMSNDPQVAELRNSFFANYRTDALKKGLCNLVKAIYPTMIHNIRATAKVLPKGSFFKNL